ncbi:MAG: PA2169 family four-helix-bundle protein [Myxococcales bacterium]|nr:PA2169 family four-helix-bundle protein [Myxococcales bacterium]
MATLVDAYSDLTPHEQRNVVAVLTELLQIALDAEQGFIHAARDTQGDSGLRAVFEDYAGRRATMAKQLRDQLDRLGAPSDMTGTMVGKVHRTFMDAVAAVVKGRPVRMLVECERGEAFALRKWESALEMKLPMEVGNLLLDQRTEIQSTHDAFDRMRRPW